MPAPHHRAPNLSLFLRLCTFGTLLAIAAPSSAEDWPNWRGPRGDGSSQDTGLPVEWNGADQPAMNVAWKVPVPGKGHASPIVWKDRIFVVSALVDSEERVLLSFDRESGRQLWQKTVLKSPLEGKHELNSFASSTPATDGELIYVAFLDREEMFVAAYDFAGEQRWQARPGPFSSKHGFCSCPVLFENLVIINGDHDGDSFVAALDRATGKAVWKIARENHTRSYVTPIVRELAGRTQLIMSGNKCVSSYDPRTGQPHWTIDGPTEQFVASIVESDGLLFMTCGFPDHHMLAIRPDGQGNVTDTHIAWREQKGASYVPSPIAVDGHFLVVSDNGILSCFEATTGKRNWMLRIGTKFSASPIAAAGLAYFTADDGVTTVVRPGPEFTKVAENQLGEHCYASPAASQGKLYFRGEGHLAAIGK